MIVTFTTDYGTIDPFVGVCHAVIAGIAPAARIIDLTHGIRRHDVAHGAATLADCAPYAPGAIHLAVVDPGVGSERRGIALRAAGTDGGWLVGPDNGLLLPAAEMLGGVAGAWELTEAAYRLPEVSATFHGRDVFAPAAAHLAAGVAPERLGSSLAPDDLVPAPRVMANVQAGTVRARVLSVDGFGNVVLAARPADLEAAGGQAGGAVTVDVTGTRHAARWVRTFADVDEGALAVTADGFGRLQIVCNRADASRALGIAPGAGVDLRAAAADPS